MDTKWHYITEEHKHYNTNTEKKSDENNQEQNHCGRVVHMVPGLFPLKLLFLLLVCKQSHPLGHSSEDKQTIVRGHTNLGQRQVTQREQLDEQYYEV